MCMCACKIVAQDDALLRWPFNNSNKQLELARSTKKQKQKEADTEITLNVKLLTAGTFVLMLLCLHVCQSGSCSQL